MGGSCRWLTLLLSQEFDLPDVIRVWDSLFADADRFSYLIQVCTAMMVYVTWPSKWYSNSSNASHPELLLRAKLSALSIQVNLNCAALFQVSERCYASEWLWLQYEDLAGKCLVLRIDYHWSWTLIHFLHTRLFFKHFFQVFISVALPELLMLYINISPDLFTLFIPSLITALKHLPFHIPAWNTASLLFTQQNTVNTIASFLTSPALHYTLPYKS